MNDEQQRTASAMADFVEALREMGLLPRPRPTDDVSGPTKERVLG